MSNGRFLLTCKNGICQEYSSTLADVSMIVDTVSDFF